MNQTRLHALDAIRGFALLLGLLLHGSMSFWPGMEELGFPIADNSKSMTLTYMFYVLHMFRMAVFFVIAGFFAHLSLHRKGSKGFLKDRLKRIAMPMIVAAGLSLVLIVPIVLWAASKLYGANFLAILQASQQEAPDQPILMQFWFLYYLLWFYALAMMCSSILMKLDPVSRFMNKLTDLFFFLCKSNLLIIILAVISAWAFFLRDNWLFWAGMPTPTEAIWNEAPAFIIYGMAFFTGWIFDRQRDCFVVLKLNWHYTVAAAVLLTGFCITRLNPAPFILIPVTDKNKLIYAISYALASWCWIFAVIGAGMQYFDKESEIRRYVADASYWIYIAHIPLIYFLQTLLMDVPWPWFIKFPLILLITTSVLFWSYDKWIRYTFIGNILNGPRQRKKSGADNTKTVQTVD